MQALRLGPAGLQPEQRFRLRHLVDDDLVLAQRPFRDAVAGWMTLASAVRSVVATPATRVKKRRMEMALVVSSEPWSITFSVSAGPSTEAVTWMPPVPLP